MGYVYTSPAVSSTSSHQAPSNIPMVNERSGISVKGTCMCLHISPSEYVCQEESMFQTKLGVFFIVEQD